MIEIINRLLDFALKNKIETSLSVLKYADNNEDWFIIVRLTKDNYRIIRCFDYKQWLELSNEQREYQLNSMLHTLVDKVGVNNET